MDAFSTATVARDRGGPAQPLLSVRGVVKHFGGRRSFGSRGVRGAVHAVDDVSFDVAKGETLGIVGESGCGKSTLARLIMQIVPADAGEMVFDGEAVGTNTLDLATYRREVQMVFQDSYASLNPRLTVEETVAFGPRVHGLVRFMSDRVLVMYLGKVVELGPSEVLLRAPRHPYTMALLASMPSMDPDHRIAEAPLFGDPPSPIDPPSGCRFHTRCKFAAPLCAATEPALAEIAPTHRAACVLAAPGSGHPHTGAAA